MLSAMTTTSNLKCCHVYTSSFQGELEPKCPMIKELAWDTSRTENFWLNVHSYKDQVGDFPLQLFSLGVLKMFSLPILNADSEWCIRQILKL